MSNLSETGKLSVERRNEIGVRALMYMNIRNGLRINFSGYKWFAKKEQPVLVKEIGCSEAELQKFIKEGMFTAFQLYCKAVNVTEPNLDYQPETDSAWIKRRNEIGFALFILKTTASHILLQFRPDSETKKAELNRAYQCSDEELQLFKEEIAHIILTKAFALY